MTSPESELPVFRYFPDPVGNGCIVREDSTCPCCAAPRHYIYRGPIYCRGGGIEEVCPWCIADGSAAKKWSAMIFNDLVPDLPATVPNDVVREITERTPGFETWQGNIWLFSRDDAMLFLNEVAGRQLLAEGNAAKIEACLSALGVEDGDLTPQRLEALESVEVVGNRRSIFSRIEKAANLPRITTWRKARWDLQLPIDASAEMFDRLPRAPAMPASCRPEGAWSCLFPQPRRPPA